jgi:hypothetical protein
MQKYLSRYDVGTVVSEKTGSEVLLHEMDIGTPVYTRPSASDVLGRRASAVVSEDVNHDITEDVTDDVKSAAHSTPVTRPCIVDRDGRLDNLTNGTVDDDAIDDVTSAPATRRRSFGPASSASDSVSRRSRPRS